MNNILKKKNKSSSKLFLPLQIFLKKILWGGIVPLEYSRDRKNIRCKKLLDHLTFPKSLVGSRTRAFTLIELLVVISIIGFLSAVVLASLNTARGKAQDSKIAQDLRQFGIAQQLYFEDNKVYAFGDKDTKVLAVEKNDNTFSSDELNIFSIRKAEAYTDTKCQAFLASANKLVAGKYLSAVPKHPKDNNNDICYKAASTTSGTNFTAYSSMITNPSKNVGVILGEINIANLGAVYDATGGQYPRSTVNGKILDLALAGDAILSTTGGTSGTIAAPPIMYTLSVAIGGTGAGSIGWSQRNINTWAAGTPMTIVATPEDGSEFTGWSPNDIAPNCTTHPVCSFTMTGNIGITAFFDEIP